MEENNNKNNKLSPDDFLNIFDTQALSRKKLLEIASDILSKKTTSKFPKLNQGKLFKLLGSIVDLCHGHEWVIRGFLGDLISASQMLMKHDTTLLTLATQLESVIRTLEKKDIVTKEEIKEIAEKEVMPMAIQHMEEEAQKAAANAGLQESKELNSNIGI